MPPVRPALALAFKVALDEAACRVHWLAHMPGPSAEEWRRIAREVRAADELFEDREWLQKPARYHRSPPPLVEPVLHRAQSHGMSFLHMRFESDYEPHAEEPGRVRWLSYEANRTAHAWLFRHSGRPRPWLICLHGYGMGFPFVDLGAFPIPWLYRQLGLNVIVPVLPLHGLRRVGWQSGDRFLGADCLDTVHAEAQAIWDLRRLIGWIRAHEGPAIGVHGLSLGGYNAALLAGFERDLSCVIAGMPATDFGRLLRLHARPSLVRAAQQAGLTAALIDRVLRVVSPLAIPPRVPHERRYIFAGVADRVVPPEYVRELWEYWDRPRIAWYDGSHLSFRWEAAATELLREALEATLCHVETTPSRAVA